MSACVVRLLWGEFRCLWAFKLAHHLRLVADFVGSAAGG